MLDCEHDIINCKNESGDNMAEMNERELLNTILHELRAVRAKVDATDDRLTSSQNQFNQFRKDMLRIS